MGAAHALGPLAAAPAPTTNAEFLTAIFGATPPDARPLVCGFAGDPAEPKGNSWSPVPWLPGVPCDNPSLNWYFTLAGYRPGADGRSRRRKADCTTVYGVMLDDIVKKMPLERLNCAPPSALIETSPGSCQAIYLFDRPFTGTGRADALLIEIIKAAGSDSSAAGASTRNCRLPFGINGKYSPVPNCKLVDWHPERRYTLEALAQAFGVDPAAPKPPRVTQGAPVPWTTLDIDAQHLLMADLCSALQFIPADDREVWVNVGHYLKASIDEEVAYVLWADWSRNSTKFDVEGLERFWTFHPDGTADHRAVFKLAAAHEWPNPRSAAARDPASVGFGVGVTLPPQVSLTPLPARAARRYEVISADPLNTARALIQRRYMHADGPRLKAWQDSFYQWDAARWAEMTPADVRAELYDFLDKEGETYYRPTQARVSALLDALKAAAHLPSTYEAPCWITGAAGAPAAELVACANGLLHLPTGSVMPTTPRFFNLNAVPFNYEPTAVAPQWFAFLRTVWPNDPEAIATLQEVFGYLLTPNTSQQKIFLIIGPKRSGKGTIARVLTEMLGPANVAGPSLTSLTETFGLQPLLGKQAAIVSDARLGGRADPKQIAENLLRISGEDRVDVARKNMTAVSLRLGVRFVLLTNELPRIADASGAMASRFIIMTMTESFIGREDPGLTAKLLHELPGVLAWAIAGWHRLNARGHFLEPRSSASAAQDLADLGSPIAAFIRDECVCAPAAEVEIAQLFAAWCTWCARQGIDRTGTRNMFGNDLKSSMGGALTQRQPRTGDGRIRMYCGIGLRVANAGTHWHACLPIAGEIQPASTSVTI